jgi:DNA-binding transcriptional ArsR family regulator
VSEAADPDEIFELLGDAYVRSILAMTYDRPMSAKELSEACEMSLPTVYRRVEDLTAHDLLVERTRIVADGHHYTTYEANLDGLDVDLTADGFALEVTRREAPSDRFTRVWQDIRGTS